MEISININREFGILSVPNELDQASLCFVGLLSLLFLPGCKYDFDSEK